MSQASGREKNQMTLEELGEPAKFSLGWFDWVWVAVIGCVTGFFHGMLPSGAHRSAYILGSIVGGTLGLLLLGSIFAWLVWRCYGRRHKAGRGTFRVVVFIFAALHLGKTMGELEQVTMSRTILFQVDSSLSSIVPILAAESYSGNRSEAVREILDEQRQLIQRDPDGRNIAARIAGLEFVAQVAETGLSWTGAFESFPQGSHLEVENVASEEYRSRMRRTLDLFEEAAGLSETFPVRADVALRRTLTENGVSGHRVDHVIREASPEIRRVGNMLKRQAEAARRWSAAVRGTYALLDQHPGQFEYDSEKGILRIGDDEVFDRFQGELNAAEEGFDVMLALIGAQAGRANVTDD